MSSGAAEQIKSRLGVLDVVQSYVRLQKAGANYKAVCPFHSEKTPSFFVSPARESWHCFGCSRGGDIFSFVQEIEGVDFIDALNLLAARAGIEVKKEDPRQRSERERLLELTECATAFFQSALILQPAACAYLKERGVTEDTIKTFRIGYAPRSWDALLGRLRAKGYRDTEIVASGLAVASARPSGARYHDRFRGRIMFPLADATGRIVGFSGRTFVAPGEQVDEAAQGGKYINTPQTLLYNKSKILYGFDRAKIAIRKENACILVEGQMDVILSHQSGVANAVAVSGTALTIDHLRAVRRIADTLIFAFDRDSAGTAAVERSVTDALAEQFDVRVITLPEDRDPADVAREGAEQWKKASAQSRPFLEFLLEEQLAKKEHQEEHLVWRDAAAKLLPFIVRMPGAVDRAFWVRAIAHRVGMREDALWEELSKYAQNSRKRFFGVFRQERGAGEAETKKRTRRDMLEERLVGIAFWKGVAAIAQKEEKNSLFREERRALLEALSSGKPLSGNDQRYAQKLAFESELFYGEGDLTEEITQLFSELERQEARERLAVLGRDIRTLELAGKNDQVRERVKEFQELSKKIR